jgi:hypothetical protein
MALSASQVYATIFQSLTGINAAEEPWVNDLFGVAKEYIDAGTFRSDDALLFDVILSDAKAPQAYKDRFKAITDLRARNSSFVPTVTEYIAMERKYRDVFSAVGLSELGSKEQISQFISNEVSADEMSDRINKAFVAIDTADDLTKNVLSERFPGLTRQDVAKGLLLGKESTYEITKKIEGAKVATEARRAGLQAVQSEQDIAAQGFNQQELRKGFQTVAQQQSGLQQASRAFGQEPVSQQEVVGDIFGTQTSGKLKGLRSQSRAEFGGTTGITSGSLGRKKQA